MDERHYGYNFTSDVITTIYIKELLLMIPSEKARYIVKRLYLDGYTEKEVATELQLSQQAVSKWFRLKGKPCPSLKGGVIRVLSCQPPRAYANPNRWRRSGE
ncbi:MULTISPECIES: helix-turn-helix domain-containing protein [Thermobacillus]|uniref:helix-turn-helix domain-containing protein n=1 Tax=Thermobacillus TaxID=76632 RepID=UPI00022C53DC|nr:MULTISPECIES: helix-turn-helix domain-containing protein [Thermobacillus]